MRCEAPGAHGEMCLHMLLIYSDTCLPDVGDQAKSFSTNDAVCGGHRVSRNARNLEIGHPDQGDFTPGGLDASSRKRIL
jgi:hypothetical protein